MRRPQQTPSYLVDSLEPDDDARHLQKTTAPHGLTRQEIDRFSGAGHYLERYLRQCKHGDLYYLTTAKGTSREIIADLQKRIGQLQRHRDFYGYTVWCFETRPILHAHFLFVGDSAIVARLRRSELGKAAGLDAQRAIQLVYDLPGLVSRYHAKERTPQAGYGREHRLGGRIKGTHKLSGGGDRVRLSRELERDAINDGLVEPWPHENAKRSPNRKEYRKRALTAQAPTMSGQILLFPELSKPVARLQAFGGGYIPRAVAAEIEFRRRQRGLSQRQLGALVGRSQGQLANALRGHDPISSAVVNRLRDALLSG